MPDHPVLSIRFRFIECRIRVMDTDLDRFVKIKLAYPEAAGQAADLIKRVITDDPAQLFGHPHGVFHGRLRTDNDKLFTAPAAEVVRLPD